MTLLDWTKNLFKDGIELFEDVKQIEKNGVRINRDCKRLKACSIGLISTNSAQEWYTICRLNCEPGTVIEEFTEEWNQLYSDNLALVKLKLTQSLLEERFNKSAKTLLDILERRSKDEWAKDQKSLTVSQKEKELSISFTGMD
jgi:hypothetical protein